MPARYSGKRVQRAPGRSQARLETRFRGGLPSLVGLVAVTVATAGALTSAASVPGTDQAPDGVQGYAAQATALTGSTGASVSSALAGRSARVSRDTARQALADAADEDLKAAAEAQAQQRNAALAKLAASAEKHAAEIAQNAWQLPLPAGSYRLTSRFGECSYLWSHCHTGLDLAAPSGTPILSIANGVVTEAGYDGAYGNKIVVTLEDGTELWYCHMSSFSASVGDRVVGGSQLGTVGSTGNTTGPHLHLEVRPGAGDPVDPYTAMSVKGQTP